MNDQSKKENFNGKILIDIFKIWINKIKILINSVILKKYILKK